MLILLVKDLCAGSLELGKHRAFLAQNSYCSFMLTHFKMYTIIQTIKRDKISEIYLFFNLLHKFDRVISIFQASQIDPGNIVYLSEAEM